MNVLTMKSYAKINLTLNILKRLSSGYHNIESVMQQIELADNITFERLAEEQIVMQSNNPSIENEDNLAYKAAELLKQRFKVKGGIKINIEKNVPLSSGLGGGSSNAATALMALNRLWKLRMKEHELIKVGVEIGSDVPFFIIGGTALVTGIGDKIKPVTRYPKLNYVLINPGYRVSTESAYNAFDKAKIKPKKPKTDGVVKALANSDVKALANSVSNDFEELMFKKHRDLRDIKTNMLRNGALNTVLSGSGPTMIGIFNSIYEAREAYFKLKDDYPFVFLTKTV